MAQFTLPERVNEGLVDVLLAMLKDDTQLAAEKHLLLGLVSRLSHQLKLVLQRPVLPDQASKCGVDALPLLYFLQGHLRLFECLFKLRDVFFQAIVLVQKVIQLGPL